MVSPNCGKVEGWGKSRAKTLTLACVSFLVEITARIKAQNVKYFVIVWVVCVFFFYLLELWDFHHVAVLKLTFCKFQHY